MSAIRVKKSIKTCRIIFFQSRKPISLFSLVSAVHPSTASASRPVSFISPATQSIGQLPSQPRNSPGSRGTLIIIVPFFYYLKYVVFDFRALHQYQNSTFKTLKIIYPSVLKLMKYFVYFL